MALSTIEVKQLSADGFQWNKYSPRVGSITNELVHFSRVVYFAFDSWDEAHNFWKSMVGKHCTRAKVRESERFTSSPWEVKVWCLKESTLELLVNRDRSRIAPKKNLPMPPIRRDWSMSEDYSAIQYEAA